MEEEEEEEAIMEVNERDILTQINQTVISPLNSDL